MRRFLQFMGFNAVLGMILLFLPPTVQAGGKASDHGGKPLINTCVYVAHGSPAERALPDKPTNPGNGHSGGGKPGSKCSKTFAAWTISTLHIYIDGSNAPSGISSSTLGTFVQDAMREWSCQSGLGESVTIQYVTSSASADITVGWGDLGTTGILGQAATSYLGGVIFHSDVTLNSNQGAFQWTEGPVPAFDSTGCIIDEANTSTSKYDLLSVVLHEMGHSLGVSHPDSRCSTRDHCYPETMYSCTDSGEFMRRTLESGDIASITSLYGA